MTLELVVSDLANGRMPFAGAAVYVWHCTREGGYSLPDASRSLGRPLRIFTSEVGDLRGGPTTGAEPYVLATAARGKRPHEPRSRPTLSVISAVVRRSVGVVGELWASRTARSRRRCSAPC